MNNIELDEEPFITTTEAAKILGISKDTLEGWRSGRRDDHGPPYYPFAHNAVRYKRSTLFAWAEQQRVENGVRVAPPKPGSQPLPWNS